MTKREYTVSRIYRESSPRENKVTRKISVLHYLLYSFIKNTEIWLADTETKWHFMFAMRLVSIAAGLPGGSQV